MRHRILRLAGLVSALATIVAIGPAPAEAKQQPYRNKGRAAHSAALVQQSSSTCDITEAQFQGIQRGWTLAQVSEHVGCAPVLIPPAPIGGSFSGYYATDPSWAGTSAVRLTFMSGKYRFSAVV